MASIFFNTFVKRFCTTTSSRLELAKSEVKKREAKLRELLRDSNFPTRPNLNPVSFLISQNLKQIGRSPGLGSSNSREMYQSFYKEQHEAWMKKMTKKEKEAIKLSLAEIKADYEKKLKSWHNLYDEFSPLKQDMEKLQGEIKVLKKYIKSEERTTVELK